MVSLEDVVSLIRVADQKSEASFGLKLIFNKTAKTNISLISRTKEQHRTLFDLDTGKNEKIEQIKDEQRICIELNLPIELNYYASINNLLNSPFPIQKEQIFYLFDCDYLNNGEEKNDSIEKFWHLNELKAFLKEIASFTNTAFNKTTYYFVTTNMLVEISSDFKKEDLNELPDIESIKQISSEVLVGTDVETRKKLFIEELVQLMAREKIVLSTVAEKWAEIASQYRKSFNLYLSEFSYHKIKISSQQDFIELNDRLHNTIGKYSGFLLAIPGGYIFIIKYFDFSGNSPSKDAILLMLGILYFVIIQFVLLRNLKEAHAGIQRDIDTLLSRLGNHDEFNEVRIALGLKKTEILPKQKKKIHLIQYVTCSVLLVTIFSFIVIHQEQLLSPILEIFVRLFCQH